MSVHPVVDGLAAYSWRLLVIAAALGGALWIIGRVWVAFVPLVVALFLARILSVPAAWLRTRGLPAALAAAAALVGFLFLLGGLSTVIGMAVANEFADLGPTVSEAIDDLERWLVEDSPFDINAADLDRFRREASNLIGESLRGSGRAVASGATVAAEVALGLVVGLIVTFFVLKDGDRFLGWARRRLSEERRELASRVASRSWRTLGGYLRGAALLGLVEGIAIALALTVVGAELAIPMALLTFLAAFVPVVGAIVAGLLAILVALATAGAAAAAVVAVVALIVQQLDNDVLAPVVYGRALALHPVVVLLAILVGGSAFGLVGSFLAVPAVAVAMNAVAEVQAYRRESSAHQTH
ncbi:MAG: AI-2E family transporter [Actinomycetota bacterium]|nr:AI-2E family transporter [Actinomycetota bacterium]